MSRICGLILQKKEKEKDTLFYIDMIIRQNLIDFCRVVVSFDKTGRRYSFKMTGGFRNISSQRRN